MSKFFMFIPYDEDGNASSETMVAIDKIIAVDVDFKDPGDDNAAVAFMLVDDRAFSCYMDDTAVKALTEILLRD